MIRIRDLIDFSGFFESFTRLFIRNVYKITQEIMIRIMDLIDFSGFLNLLLGCS